jgi:hypothetical protein
MIPSDASERLGQAGPPGSGAVSSGSRRANDPWAHRRAEPRTFTFLWTLYLLATTGIAIASVGLYGAVHEEGARTAARTILLVASIGVSALWPMTRLCQRAPEPGVSWAVQDTLAIVLPLQAVIWPHIWLAGWSLEVAGAVALVLAAWAVLVGGLLALAFSRGSPGPVSRTIWMLVFVALPAAGPVTGLTIQALSSPTIETTRWVQMSSAVTAVDQLAPRRPWQGSSLITHEHWVAIGLMGVGAGAVWLLALPMARGHRRGRELR